MTKYEICRIVQKVVGTYHLFELVAHIRWICGARQVDNFVEMRGVTVQRGEESRVMCVKLTASDLLVMGTNGTTREYHVEFNGDVSFEHNSSAVRINARKDHSYVIWNEIWPNNVACVHGVRLFLYQFAENASSITHTDERV